LADRYSPHQQRPYEPIAEPMAQLMAQLMAMGYGKPNAASAAYKAMIAYRGDGIGDG